MSEDFDRPEVKALVAKYRSNLQEQRLRHVQNLIAQGVCTSCNTFAGEVAVRITIPGRGDLAILCGQCDVPDEEGKYTMDLEMVDYYRQRSARNDYGLDKGQEFVLTYSDAARGRRGLDVPGAEGAVRDVPVSPELRPEDAGACAR